MDDKLDELRQRHRWIVEQQDREDRILEQRVTRLEHLTQGVDGNHGLCKEVTTLAGDTYARFNTVDTEMKEVRKEVRDVTHFQTKILGAMILGGFIAEMVIAHMWK